MASARESRCLFFLLQSAFLSSGLAANMPKCASGKDCPHLLMVVVDDLGWNNVPWHNKDLETVMPQSLQLAREGVELDRHYAYVYCSPTRSSLLSGRLPYHVNQVNLGPEYATSGVHEKMTTIPRKLKQVGYRTHAVGKWHCGSSSYAKTPHGRGFDTHLGYLLGAEDHYTQRACIDLTCNLPNPAPFPFNKTFKSPFVDLWFGDKPAYGRNGTYGDEMYTKFVVETLEQHPTDVPIFFYIALQNDHQPLQAPQAYVEKFPSSWTFDRRMYAAMGVFWDEALGTIVDTLKKRGMWEQTLLVLSGDNGGPVYPSAVPGFDHCGGANNWPLLGGKSTGFEGGVRVAAFASGGFLPEQVRGTKLTANIHITDWYTTFSHLAGVDHHDAPAVAAGVPDVDSVDVWPLVSGVSSASPRWEIPLAVGGISEDAFTAPPGWRESSTPNAAGRIAALIQGDYKLVGGRFASGFHQAPEWPTEAACCNVKCWNKPELVKDCGTAETPRCLFNIRADPEERKDLFSSQPEIVARMTARLHELEASVFNPQRMDRPSPSAYEIMLERYNGFIGPWQDLPVEDGTEVLV